MKKTIKLTEIELKSFIKESVNKVLNEIGDTSKGQKKLGALSMRHTLNEPNYDSRNNKLKSYKLKEDLEPYDIVEWEHFSKDNLEPDYYDGFVVLDGTEANLGNFETSYDAIDYARELASKNKYGTYYVYGTENNEYSEDTLIYDTDEDFQ